MFREELSDADISMLIERIALAMDHSELTCHEAEAIASVQVRLRRYGNSLFLSEGERHRLHRIFDKTGCAYPALASISCAAYGLRNRRSRRSGFPGGIARRR